MTTTPPTIAAPAFPEKMEDFVEQFVKLRDAIKASDEAHKKKTEGARAYLDSMNAEMLDRLGKIGGDSIKTSSGTVYRTVRKSATLADGALFRDFIINTQQFDLVDWKANATAVSEFIDTIGKGNPPPGVNYSTIVQVGVRRA